jgi:hypothetical protein
MLSARRQFLDAFLGALGAAEIVECAERDSEVRGTIRFAEDSEVIDLSGDEGGDLQDFAWRVREMDAPSLLAYRIADVLNRYQLVEVDKLRVSRPALRAFLQNEHPDEPVAPEAFDAALAELLAIEVAMVEDGAETGEVFRLRA